MKLAIVTNKPYYQCETFIQAQIDYLPFEIEHFWGYRFPFSYKKSDAINSRIQQKLMALFFHEERKIRVLFKKKRINVVLAHYGMIGVEVLHICKQLDLPIIVHFHGHDAARKTILKTYNNGYKDLFLYAKCHVISVSHQMTKQLISLGCSERKIVYNPCSPNDLFLKIEPKFNKKQFIAVGRFVEKKAPHLTIISFKKVVERYPEAVLIMAGGGALLDSCKDLVQAMNIEKNVFFPGKISPEEYRKFLTESLAYVQHSIEAQDGDMEGTPVSILEASAAGLPVISTRHGGIPDVILDGTTGLLSDEKDVSAMADNMEWVIKNRQEAIFMGKNGKKRIADNYSMERHINKLANLIERVGSN